MLQSFLHATWRLKSRTRPWAFGAALLPILVACATPDLPPGAFSKDRAADVFAYGYDRINDYYYERVNIRSLALHGLRGLNRIDPDIKITDTDGRVVLAVGAATVGDFTAPPAEDSLRWARLTAEVVAAGRAASPSLRDASVERVYKTVFEAELADLDPFSRYSGADEARENRANRDGYEGLGITLNVANGVVKVASVMPGTPAAVSDIKADDIIVSVNGEALAGLETPEVLRRLRGPADSKVELNIARAAQIFSVTLTRARIVPVTVSFKREGDVAHIHIGSFNQRTARSVQRAVDEAKREIGDRLRGYILDLRGNPGGLLDQAVAVTDLFLNDGAIVSTQGRHPRARQSYRATGGDIAEGLPMVVLVNGGSASAAEIVAASLQDNRRALVVGTSSYGKGSVQTVIRLPNDGEITLTWARLYSPGGFPLHKFGVVPQVCTSQYYGDIGILIRDIWQGSPQPGAALAQRPQATKLGDQGSDILRRSCPARTQDNDFDLRVARQIIEEPSLYARANALYQIALMP
jgi:carboxyl-terminal processing protease